MTFMDESTHPSTLQLYPKRSKLRGIKPQEIKKAKNINGKLVENGHISTA